MQSTTANNVQHLTAEEQLDVLWKALQSTEYWIGVGKSGTLSLFANECDDLSGRIGNTLATFQGSRRSIIERLHAQQIGEALDGPKLATDDIVDALRPAILQVMSGTNDMQPFGVPVIKMNIDC